MLQLNRKGFTLIELLVVIAIIGVLGSIVFAPFNEARKKGRDGKRIAELKGLQSSLLLFSEDNGGCFPDMNSITAANANDFRVTNNKYITSTLYNKIKTLNSSQLLANAANAWDATKSYGIRSVGDSTQCTRTAAAGLEFFPYYQLLVELETHSSGLDGDADSDMTPATFSGGTGKDKTGTAQTAYNGLNTTVALAPETCTAFATGSWQCVFDLSNN